MDDYAKSQGTNNLRAEWDDINVRGEHMDGVKSYGSYLIL